jgi:hypothetical protein
MSNPVPLNKEKHLKYRVVEPFDCSRYKDQHLIAIVAQDFYTLSAEFPLVFVKNSESGQFVAVAIMGFNKGVNLYCQTASWTPLVRPISFTNPPFSIAFVNKDSDQIVLLVDESSPLISETEGEPLFDVNGENSEYLKKRIDSVMKIAEQTNQTQTFCNYLASKKLLASKQLKVQQQQQDSPQYVIDGIFTIDEDALNQLPIEEFDELRKKGLLGLVYAHLNSLNQINRLAQKQFQADNQGVA